MARKEILGGLVFKAFSVTELLRWASRIATVVEAQAWGVLAGVSAFLAWSLWMQNARVAPFVGVYTACGLAYVVAVAIFTIISRSAFSAQRCLTSARLWFETQRIDKEEYRKMRAYCLKKCHVA